MTATSSAIKGKFNSVMLTPGHRKSDFYISYTGESTVLYTVSIQAFLGSISAVSRYNCMPVVKIKGSRKYFRLGGHN